MAFEHTAGRFGDQTGASERKQSRARVESLEMGLNESSCGRALLLATMGACLLCGPAEAAPVVQSEGSVDINWTTGELVATGSADPKGQHADLATQRLDAETRATRQARQHMQEALARILIGHGTVGENQLEKPAVRARVAHIVDACPVRDTRYYSGGGVDAVVVCELAQGLGLALAPLGPRTEPLGPPADSPKKQKKADEPTEVRKESGIILVLPTVGLTPILLPTLRSQGDVLFEPESARTEGLRQQGGFRYVASLEEAKRHPRAGKTPVIVRAFEIKPDGFEMMSGDAERLRVHRALLYNGKVVVVLPR